MGRADAITVELQGGLGNQLFGLGVGLAQALRFDVPLILDINRILVVNPMHVQRKLEIEPLLAKIKHPVAIEQRRTMRKNHLAQSARSRLPRPKRFQERSLDFDARSQKIRPGWSLSGYFQSPEYLQYGAADMLNEAFTTLSDDYGLRAREEVFMHIRRGDYMSSRHFAHHGIASLDFFDRASRLVRQIEPSAQFEVFTDSPEMIPQSCLDDWGAILNRSQVGLEPMHAMLQLSTNNGLIMSNSSFSWWAAWISQNRNPGALFIAPRPWLASGTSAHTLLLPSWITLGA